MRWTIDGLKSVVNIQYHIVGMDPDEFPENPDIRDVDFFEMESDALKKMIEKSAIISGASDDKRAHINGSMFEKIKREKQTDQNSINGRKPSF